MAIVSCPECSKKLKVADTSVGKKVKCSCGKVFVASIPPSTSGRGVGGEGDAAPTPVLTVPDKVMVGCTECGAKLKVAATSLGKKMKCPKCAGVFIASAEEETPAFVKKAPKPLPGADVDAPRPKAKAGSDDDMDALFTFAQKNGAKEADGEPGFQDDDEEIKPRGKGKLAKKTDPDEDEDNFPKSKSKFGAKSAGKPPRLSDDDADQKPVYPRRTFLNLFVFLLLFIFIAFFAVVFLGQLPHIGLPKSKGPAVKGRPMLVEKEDADEKKKDVDEVKDKEKSKEEEKKKDVDKEKSKDKDDDKKDADKEKDKDKDGDVEKLSLPARRVLSETTSLHAVRFAATPPRYSATVWTAYVVRGFLATS